MWRDRLLPVIDAVRVGALELVEVSGPSMVPTLRHGDQLVAWRGAHIRAGDVVLGRFGDLPDRLVVKRAVRPVGDRWWLASDNPFAGGDSESHGPAEVVARVMLRVGPGRPGWVRRAEMGT